MEIEVKRGEQLTLDVTRVDANGAPINLTGVAITSSAKQGAFAAALTVTMVNAALGQFRLTATATVTAGWPIARLSADVKYDGGGGAIRYSKTFYLKVGQQITP